MRTQAFARKTNGSFNQLTKVKVARGGRNRQNLLGLKTVYPFLPLEILVLIFYYLLWKSNWPQIDWTGVLSKRGGPGLRASTAL